MSYLYGRRSRAISVKSVNRPFYHCRHLMLLRYKKRKKKKKARLVV